MKSLHIHVAVALATLGLAIAGCEKTPRQEANEAKKELKQGDVGQAAEEAGEAVDKAVR